MTDIYFIRHAESPFVHGNEKERGLSEKGKEKSRKVAMVLRNVEFSCIASSSYKRAVDTVLPLASIKNMTIESYDELVERPIKGLDYTSEWPVLEKAIKKSFDDINYCLEGGETTLEAQKRAIPVFEELIKRHAGKSIAVGTHGNIMTIILNHFDSSYGYEFWKASSKPDIYKASFEGNRLLTVERVDF